MSDFADLGGVRVVSGSITIPLYGLWSGDVMLATDEPIGTDVKLSLGNLTLACHVYREALFAGTRQLRLVAGAGGWRKVLPSKQYDFSSGVKLSTVLGDAASESGERVSVPVDYFVGTGYVRENAKASRVLRQLAGPNWYCDPDGVTQIKAWPSTRVASDFQVINQDGGRGMVEISTEDYASWLPGTTFASTFIDGTLTNGGVMYRFSGDGTFRLEVLTS